MTTRIDLYRLVDELPDDALDTAARWLEEYRVSLAAAVPPDDRDRAVETTLAPIDGALEDGR